MEQIEIHDTQEYRDEFDKLFDQLKAERKTAREGISADKRFRLLAHPIDSFETSESALFELFKVLLHKSDLSASKRKWLLWLDSTVLVTITSDKQENENENQN